MALSVIPVVSGRPTGAKVESGVWVTYPQAAAGQPLSNCTVVLLQLKAA